MNNECRRRRRIRRILFRVVRVCRPKYSSVRFWLRLSGHNRSKWSQKESPIFVETDINHECGHKRTKKNRMENWVVKCGRISFMDIGSFFLAG